MEVIMTTKVSDDDDDVVDDSLSSLTLLLLLSSHYLRNGSRSVWMCSLYLCVIGVSISHF